MLASCLWTWVGRVRERGPADGPPLMVLPGFFASDRSTLLLQRELARAGYRVAGWGMGRNIRVHARILDDIVERLERFAGGTPAILVGWSLGGVFAREVAKLRPDLVRGVFTMGSPFSGDPRANHAWRLYELVNDHKVDCPPVDVRLDEKPPVPTIALWSRRDGMVAPACSRGGPGEADECVELRCSHMGFAVSPRGVREVARAVCRIAPPQSSISQS